MAQNDLDDAGQSQAVARIRDRVSRRLRRFCPDFSAEQFETLVRDVTRSEFIHGFNGAEKESRLQVFDANYRALDRAAAES